MVNDYIELEFILEGNDFDTAGQGAGKVKKVLQQIGVKPEIIRRIAISAYEAEMNVIIHAKRGKMSVFIHHDHTKIIFDDEGPGIPDIDLAMQEGYSTAPDHIREMGFGAGMGLPNIRKSCDDLDVQSKINVGTTITMTIRH